jgi:hypothetical protein
MQHSQAREFMWRAGVDGGHLGGVVNLFLELTTLISFYKKDPVLNAVSPLVNYECGLFLPANVQVAMIVVIGREDPCTLIGDSSAPASEIWCSTLEGAKLYIQEPSIHFWKRCSSIHTP